MAKARGTDGSLLASLPWTLAALAVALAAHVPYLPAWITLAFVACGIWRYRIERHRQLLPSIWLRAALAVSCFLGVLATYSSISGVGPGSALLAIMAAMKLLETRRRRDQFVLLFISMFLVMSSLLREQYIWSLPYLVVAMLLILTAWLRMSAADAETARQSFRTGSRLMLYAAPLAIIMWVFFPRIATPFWSVPIDTSSGISGLSDTMSPGDISSLSLSDAVAFRVRFEDQVPAPHKRYWRGLVLHRYNGRSWSGGTASLAADARDRITIDGDAVRYRVTLEPTRQQWVFALDIPYHVSLPRTFMGPQQQLARAQPIDQRVAYDAVSYTDYRTDIAMSSTFRQWYLDLPDDSNPRTSALARQLRQQAGSDAAFIEAVLGKFHEEAYFYTLEPPALGADPVDQFLFETRQGFCEHYASAFAVMMRAAGIPARIVLGYQGGEMNPMGEYMIVRQADAHAWTEVWLHGIGWQRVDPTAAVAPERIADGMSGAMLDGFGAAWGLSVPSRWLHQVGLTVDALNASWNELILGYGPKNQERFMQWLGMDDPDWRQMMLTLIGSVVALIVAISMLMMLRYRPPQIDRAALLYRRFVKRTGVQPLVGETPGRYATRAALRSTVPAATIDSITANYLDARYGSTSPAALRKLEAAVAQL